MGSTANSNDRQWYEISESRDKIASETIRVPTLDNVAISVISELG